jgi:hypothetical protein
MELKVRDGEFKGKEVSIGEGHCYYVIISVEDQRGEISRHRPRT